MIKLAVMFGGKSTEHDVSVVSGVNVISNLDNNKYDIYPIYIDYDGFYYKFDINIINSINFDEDIDKLEKIDNIGFYLEDIDIVFPVLHGLYGEDGSIQGMLELLGKKYVGCKILSSSLCMDKVYAKILFKECGINVSKSIYIKKNKDKYFYINDTFDISEIDDNRLINIVKDNFNYPVFIKPSNSGSSVGVNKAYNEIELIKYTKEALKFDKKVLIEEAIVGREVECAVLGNDDVVTSYVGEVISADDFYSYESKYKNSQSKTIIPANIDGNIMDEVRKLAIKAYRACDCCGLSRVDFFIEKDTNRIILNEINTMPGFTEISMYPKLMKHFGYSYSLLLDKLIELSMEL